MRIESKFRHEFGRRLLAWYREHSADLPWRRAPNPYSVLVSEFMLQQTRVASVVAYYTRWMERFPNFSTLAEASEEEVLLYWEGLGYYTRACNLRRIACLVVAEHQGELPSRLDELERLPGVGRYTAGAIASLAFGKRAPLVDGNVRRLFRRLFALPEEISSDHLWEIAEALLPRPSDCAAHNSALMEMGRTICMPRRADCPRCPVADLCGSRGRWVSGVRRASPTRCEESAALIVRGSRTWLEPSQGGRYRGLWKLPMLDSDRMRNLGEACGLSYSITRYRVRLTVFWAEWKEREHGEGRWVLWEELASLPLPTPHRKVLAIALPSGGAVSKPTGSGCIPGKPA
ncbi:MAG: A/G-specific adenine glycosylase [Candidatus Methylacidiphilaceae bacterium]